VLKRATKIPKIELGYKKQNFMLNEIPGKVPNNLTKTSYEPKKKLAISYKNGKTSIYLHFYC
jgi:hypothetical protein